MQILFNNKLWIALLLLFAVLLPYGPAIPNIMMGVVGFYWLLHLVTGRIQLSKKKIVAILVFSSFYLLCAVSYFYSDDIPFYLKKIALLAPLLLFPLFIISMPYKIESKDVFYIGLGFSSSVLLLLFISFIKQFAENGFVTSAFIGNNLSATFIDIHYLSLSLYVSFAALITCYCSLFNFKTFNTKYLKRFTVIASFFLVGFLILLGGRTSIAIFILFLFVFLCIYYLRTKKLLIPLSIFGITLLAIGMVAISNSAFREKWKEIYSYDSVENPEESYWGGTGIRLLIWDCALKVIENDPLLGVGLGDDMDQLELCYKVYMKGQLLATGTYFHAHNMYLQSAVRVGFIGLFLFLAGLGYGLFMALKKRGVLYLIFLGVFILSAITESFYMINAGVIFFAFFNAVLFKQTVSS
ncbi:O-antigen ligase family protein [Jejudonia soesokkakensis]|uniref:O-antigen ligase family protein n=1 Tax=Jejudonia soesokkakensis TaxID=1323432 RepID=A0ABW2MMK9_9FLAO